MAGNISEKDIKDFFDAFDADGSGSIDVKEIKSLLVQMGLPKDDAETDAKVCIVFFIIIIIPH